MRRRNKIVAVGTNVPTGETIEVGTNVPTNVLTNVLTIDPTIELKQQEQLSS